MAASLMELFGNLKDPRGPCGVQDPLVSVLALCLVPHSRWTNWFRGHRSVVTRRNSRCGVEAKGTTAFPTGITQPAASVGLVGQVELVARQPRRGDT